MRAITLIILILFCLAPGPALAQSAAEMEERGLKPTMESVQDWDRLAADVALRAQTALSIRTDLDGAPLYLERYEYQTSQFSQIFQELLATRLNGQGVNISMNRPSDQVLNWKVSLIRHKNFYGRPTSDSFYFVHEVMITVTLSYKGQNLLRQAYNYFIRDKDWTTYAEGAYKGNPSLKAVKE